MTVDAWVVIDDPGGRPSQVAGAANDAVDLVAFSSSSSVRYERPGR